ncbi:DUF373 family protein [Pyrococcus yayanosii]|uniref:DUF373 family protein n=1 Tax=Pyrococcus yayanosii (strain CH1 / JCM 16557) TaxID=529709 RepID=F8AFN9_PYRYC|nr:DUF373 family protein [Pyrococcus yayanosii]AEH25012.1 hypothetical protein PYCH_13400 [Pyrococcus yayanosii CH1]
MRVLILAIDRDDDFGVKADVRGPVIGRDACVKAALKLSLADPEDSDANVLYAAVKLYDELKGKGEFDEVGVALITGHPDVGVKSDLELGRQLEEVLKKFPADGVITVTDGAEDEQVFPLISSRVPIISTRRVVVKQSPGIETTYYVIARYVREILSDPEASKILLGIPGMIVLLYGLARLISIKYPPSAQIVSSAVTGFVMLLVGGYFFAKGFGIRVSLRESITKGFITFISVVTGLLVITAGAINVYLRLEDIALEMIGGQPGSELIALLIFLNAVNSTFILGLAIMVGGKIIQGYLRRDYHLWYYVTGLVMLPAFWKVVDLMTKYSNPLITLERIEIVEGITVIALDIGLSILLGAYLRERLKRWVAGENERIQPERRLQ